MRGGKLLPKVDATPDPLIGAIVDGRYRVDHVVGAGGFGTVYAAFHIGLGARVALKVPRTDDLPPSVVPDAIAMFLEEGRTLKRLRHPNLAGALDVGLLPPDAQGTALPYLVIEWCEGPTLRDWLVENPRPLSQREAWSLIRPVFEAIAYAHAEGIAHRDIKPANIILERRNDGRLVPRVIDFGIAKVLGDVDRSQPEATRTTSTRRAFTPKYAAPEQITGVRTGPWTDVYALALVLVELLVGRAVFSSDDDARNAMLAADLPTPAKLGLRLGAWDREIARALAPRPADRFADASMLMRALDGFAATIDATPAPPAHQLASLGPTRRIDASPGAQRAVSDAPGEMSVIPSSHTLQTAMRTVSPSPTRVRAGSAAGAAAAILATLAFVAAVAATVQLRAGRWPFDEAAAPSATLPPPPTTASSAPPLTPLSSLTQDAVMAAATSQGLLNCTAMTLPATITISCQNGQIILADRNPGTPDPGPQIQRGLVFQAKSFGAIYGAARFALDGTWGLMVSTRPELIDGLMSRLLVGVRHDATGDGTVPPFEGPIPARLSEWRGPEVAARLAAIGADITYDNPFIASPMTQFMVDGGLAGSTFFFAGDADTWLAGSKTPGATPFAYARDGKALLICYGTGRTGRIPFLKQLLGPTTATQFGTWK